MQARILACLLAVAMLAGCSHVADHTARNDGMPRDVGRFLDQRSACDHFRNEDPFDDDRGDFLADQSSMYCTGSDRELAFLREKYADRPDVLAALQDLEDRIEGR